MSTEWAGVVNTTTTKFLKGFQDNTLRTRKVLAPCASATLERSRPKAVDAPAAAPSPKAVRRVIEAAP